MSELTVPYLVLQRCDPACNMARFYVLTIEPTLFGDTALVREWGRLGQRGRRRMDLFAGRVQAVEALEAWLARKKAVVMCPKIPRLECNRLTWPSSLNRHSWNFLQAGQLFCITGAIPDETRAPQRAGGSMQQDCAWRCPDETSHPAS